MGDFPFGATPSSGAAPTGAGGGGGGDTHSALVAFPVSIQPSSVSGGTSGSNIILQAQNMGQPFLLTPSYDRGGGSSNPLFSSQGFTPPTTLPAGATPGPRDLEQLKLQYDRLQQQMLQQQLLLQQGLQHHLQQQSREMAAASAQGAAAHQAVLTPRDREKRDQDGTGAAGEHSEFITSDVMMTSRPGSATSPRQRDGEGKGMVVSMDTDDESTSASASKKPKLSETSLSASL